MDAGAPPDQAPPEAGSPLDSRDFRWLLLGRGVDALGNAMYGVALGFGMLRLFGSLTSMGVVVGAASLGLVSFLLVGGVYADRLPRRTVLVWSNLAAAATQVAIVTLVVLDVPNLAALTTLSFVGGAAAAFDGPASTALVPQTLPPELLHRGNAQLNLVRRATNIGGAAAAGILTAAFGAPVALGVNAVSFAAAGLCFARVGVRSGTRPVDHAPTTPWADLREGWDEFRARSWVWIVVLAFFVLNGAWVGGFHLLGIAIADQGMGAARWGLVLAAEGVGGIVGTTVASRREPERPLRDGMIGAVVAALPLAVLAAAPQFVPLLVSTFAAGIGIMVFAVNWETSLQKHIPAERLARVSSFDSVGSFAAIPLGSFVAGPLAEALGIQTVVAGAAVLSVLAAVAGLASPSVRNLR